MKLIIRDYLASLREREELDAVLPDLLSELGFTVYSRPGRGTTQHGVDIAAVGRDEDGERKVFLFAVKQGDLTRSDWDGNPQAVRPSLNEICDVYIRNHIPDRYANLKIVICLAFGGDVREQVREVLSGYIARNTSERVTFDEWNGDKIAGLILEGMLSEEVLPKPLRSNFRKAVAMIDDPDASSDFFRALASNLYMAGTKSQRAAVRAARQMNICLWILYVWARDIGNIESSYRASEEVVLRVWELFRPFIGKKSKNAKCLLLLVNQVIALHMQVAFEYLEKVVLPYAEIRHGISSSVGSGASLDVNWALFDLFGRIGLAGLWFDWFGVNGDKENQESPNHGVEQLISTGLSLIRNNPALFLPISDQQATDIALFLLLWLRSGTKISEIGSWLHEMALRLDFTVRTRGRYPSCHTDYRDLSGHPRDRSSS